MNQPGGIRGVSGDFPYIESLKKKGQSNGTSFQDTLKGIVSNVNSQINESDQLTQDFALGKTQNIHEVMIAAEKAGLSLKFLMQVRNKLMDAYQQIMRMSF